MSDEWGCQFKWADRHHHPGGHGEKDMSSSRASEWMAAVESERHYEGEWNGRKYKSPLPLLSWPFHSTYTHPHLSWQKLWISNHFHIIPVAFIPSTITPTQQQQRSERRRTFWADVHHLLLTTSLPSFLSRSISPFNHPSISIWTLDTRLPEISPAHLHGNETGFISAATTTTKKRRITQTGKHPANGTNWIFRRWNEIKTWKSGIHVIHLAPPMPPRRRDGRLVMRVWTGG